MALGTYSELQTAVAEWAWRQGDTEFAARVPDLITLGEKRINDDLRIANQEATATVTLTSSAGSLPADYLEMRRVVANVSPVSVLQGISAEQAIELYPTSAAGYPVDYTIVGSTITVYPSTTANLSIVYYASVPTLSIGSPTNWLLTKAPQLLLYAALVEASPYMMDDARSQTWGALYERALAKLQASDNVGRFGQMQSRVRFPTP